MPIRIGMYLIEINVQNVTEQATGSQGNHGVSWCNYGRKNRETNFVTDGVSIVNHPLQTRKDGTPIRYDDKKFNWSIRSFSCCRNNRTQLISRIFLIWNFFLENFFHPPGFKLSGNKIGQTLALSIY